MSILIVGGGWAGLAAAVHLSRLGHPVTVLESAPQLGGRARSVTRRGIALDNGQHLAIGAYRQLLALLAEIGVVEGDAFLRLPLRLEQYRPDAPPFQLRLPALPAPLHLLTGLAGARGLSRRRRLRALGLCLRLAADRFQIEPDRPLGPWLRSLGQDEFLLTTLWEPLCVATLNTPLDQASSRVFLKVLKDSFSHHRSDSDLLIPRRPLGELLPCAAERYLSRHGGVIRTRSRVVTLERSRQAQWRVRLANGETITGQGVILATPPFAAARLTAPHPQLAALSQRLKAFRYQPIATVYLSYPPSTRLPFPMLGLSGGLGQWVFDRGACGQAGVMAVVISAEGPHSTLDRKTLGERVAAELAGHFPRWPVPRWIDVITEKRATFACTVAGAAQRPGVDTALPGLWLAGDHVDTGYPATLEGAVRSGRRAAEAALKALGLSASGRSSPPVRAGDPHGPR